MRIIFIGFGLLDLLAFYRCSPILNRIIENHDFSALIPSVLPAFNLLLILSLLATGPLCIVGNKYAHTIYYFQFPFRLAFLTALTFGFMLKLYPMQVGTFGHGMMMATVIALEAIRLMITIQAHRKA